MAQLYYACRGRTRLSNHMYYVLRKNVPKDTSERHDTTRHDALAPHILKYNDLNRRSVRVLHHDCLSVQIGSPRRSG